MTKMLGCSAVPLFDPPSLLVSCSEMSAIAELTETRAAAFRLPDTEDVANAVSAFVSELAVSTEKVPSERSLLRSSIMVVSESADASLSSDIKANDVAYCPVALSEAAVV